jgi:hypothetical protein
MKRYRPALALTDRQLEIVMTAASSLPVEKRCLFLERIAARLRLIAITRFNDTELDVRCARRCADCSRRQRPERRCNTNDP